MFGMGGSEIIVILVVALLFLGPDKLPAAAKSISKGIRDIKKQSRALQQQIEGDEQIGGAIRDLKSALRGEELPSKSIRPRPKKELAPGPSSPDAPVAGTPEPTLDASPNEALPEADKPFGWLGDSPDAAAEAPPDKPTVTLPASAGEPDPGVVSGDDDSEELAAMIKPASGTIAKGSEPKHG